MTSPIALSPGQYGDDCAVIVTFSNVSGKGILHSTKEYSLSYIPKLDKWVGDVIAYGGWFDLDEEEILELRSAYNLDKIMGDYLLT